MSDDDLRKTGGRWRMPDDDLRKSGGRWMSDDDLRKTGGRWMSDELEKPRRPPVNGILAPIPLHTFEIYLFVGGYVINFQIDNRHGAIIILKSFERDYS